MPATDSRRLWLPFGAVLLLIGGIVGWSLYAERDAIDTRERERLVHHARVIDENLGRQLYSTNRGLTSIRDDLPFLMKQKDRKVLINRRLQAMSDTMPGVRTLFIFDADATVIASNREELVGRNFRDRDYFQTARQSRNPAMLHISPPYKTVLGAFAMTLVKVIPDERGEVAGMVGATIDPEYFQTLLDSVRYAPDTRASISHGSGSVFLSSPRIPGIEGMNLAKPGTFLMRHIESGKPANLFVGTVSSTGDARTVALRTVPVAKLPMDSSLIISASRETKAIFADWQRRAEKEAGLFGVLVLATVLGLYFYQKKQRVYDRLMAAHEAEKKQAEEMLRESEERHRMLFATSNDAILLTAPDGRILQANPAACRMFQRTEPEIQEGGRSLLADSRDPRLSAAVEERGRTGQFTGELLFIRADGTKFPGEMSTSVFSDMAGRARTSMIIRDITERKRMEGMLRNERERLITILDTVGDPIFVKDNDHRIILANRAFYDIFSLDEDAVIGNTLAEHVPPDERQHFLGVDRRVLDSGIPDLCEETLTVKGFTRTIVTRKTRFIADSGNRFLVGSMHDITERKRLEEMRLQSQKLESLGTLASGIAHDFNNILAAIRGNADLAAEDVGPDHVAAPSLEEIKRASTRAHELVRRIMVFGRPKDAQPKVVALSSVVDEALQLLRPTILAGVALHRQFAADCPHALADASQIHEVVVNLTTNAAHAIGLRAGTIEYRLEAVQVEDDLARKTAGLKLGQYARLTVSDDGCGMDAQTVERIFDAFFTTKPLGEGTGLGLSMVYGVMKGLGGAVTVESTPGKGSRFALYFPAAKEQACEEEQCAPAQNLLSAGQRVLYVDDEEALVSLAKRVISRLGHSISGFTDPKEALEAFRMQPQSFDLVVTDLAMPQMSGMDLAREVLALRPEIPVLMTTGNIRPEDVRLAHEAGIRDVLHKPVTVDELGRVLDRIFSTTSPNGKPSA